MEIDDGAEHHGGMWVSVLGCVKSRGWSDASHQGAMWSTGREGKEKEKLLLLAGKGEELDQEKRTDRALKSLLTLNPIFMPLNK